MRKHQKNAKKTPAQADIPARVIKVKTRENGERLVPSGELLAGAQRAETDRPTNAAIPSDKAVEEMREWSEEHRQ